MTSHGLSGRLTRYGDDRFARFLREAFLEAMGLTPAAFDRPVVGIASTASDFNPCHATAPQLIDAIRRGVTMAGGIPFAFPTISIHESFAYPSSLLLRNLLAMDTEEMLRALPLDAVVLVGGCDKTLPAQVMGAISADVPALVAPVGPMLAGWDNGERLGACTDCRRLWAAHRAGEIDDARLARAHGRLMPTHGTCMVMGTASTMACLIEALGFVLPGGSTIPAVHSERLRFGEETGRRAVEMAGRHAPTARSLVTAGSLRNAVVVLQALGGSTNALIHLAAIAGRAGVAFDFADVDRIGRETPVLVDVKPIGGSFVEDFHQAGALPALMRRLVERLDSSVSMADGRRLGDVLETWPAWSDDRIIRPIDRPVAPGEALAILRGSLAPDGAVLKRAAASLALLQHEGPALVFEGLDDLAARIDDPALSVTPDHVLVLRGIGPIGAGMPEAGSIAIPAKLARAGVKDMVRLSDARMSGTAYGTVILHVAPEAAAGGPLALVRDGDRIRLDTAGRRLDLLVDQSEMARRRAAFRRPPLPPRGYARLHAEHVLQADRGCDFDFLVPADGSLVTSYCHG
ncbi:MAG: dihydroxy-acid dehydratase [Acidobacteria bacterium RIFCSPLOWO2_02_FULL_67_36]|nr:MAG: dihydroxy-acid dehydratase [Acidobacteria bacterium RIFCSPLOWO2_02_FULL_67_36]OFW24642.1 MAG: dihydroxy-acid dehydratase [Acidobacteria bacterium RIFCSPLOWO2_12_FULL_66_21]